jgi:hypothetical protein
VPFRFPDNVVVLSSQPTNEGRILCIEGFEDFENKLMVKGRFFKNVSETFSTPYLSSTIGNFVCKGGLCDSVVSLAFSEIVSKCFAFSLKMPSRCPIDPANTKQEWIVQEICHSGMY